MIFESSEQVLRDLLGSGWIMSETLDSIVLSVTVPNHDFMNPKGISLQIQDIIENTTMIKKMREDSQYQRSELQCEIKQLQKYKNYYDLEYDLTHGKVNS